MLMVMIAPDGTLDENADPGREIKEGEDPNDNSTGDITVEARASFGAVKTDAYPEGYRFWYSFEAAKIKGGRATAAYYALFSSSWGPMYFAMTTDISLMVDITQIPSLDELSDKYQELADSGIGEN